MHTIQAIIGKTNHIDSLSHRYNVPFVKLRQEIALIPLTKDFSDYIRKHIHNITAIPTDNFAYADLSLFNLLTAESADEQVGYIETDYFGGQGSQSAILFEKGQIWGQFKTESGIITEKRAINIVLERLGVTKSSFLDEFQAIGLMEFRNNNQMIRNGG